MSPPVRHGYLAVAALLPARQGKHTAVETAAVPAAFLLIVAVPRYSLLPQVRLFALFRAFGVTGLVLINRRVCPLRLKG